MICPLLLVIRELCFCLQGALLHRIKHLVLNRESSRKGGKKLVKGNIYSKKEKGNDNEENIWIRKIFCLREGKVKIIGFIRSKKAKNVIVGLQP